MKNSRKKRERVVQLTERLMENKYLTISSEGGGDTFSFDQKRRDQNELVNELNSPELAGIRTTRRKKH